MEQLHIFIDMYGRIPNKMLALKVSIMEKNDIVNWLQKIFRAKKFKELFVFLGEKWERILTNGKI